MITISLSIFLLAFLLSSLLSFLLSFFLPYSFPLSLSYCFVFPSSTIQHLFFLTLFFFFDFLIRHTFLKTSISLDFFSPFDFLFSTLLLKGVVMPSDIGLHLTQHTALVTVMHSNNEVRVEQVINDR